MYAEDIEAIDDRRKSRDEWSLSVGAGPLRSTGDTGTRGRAQGGGNEFVLKRTNGNHRIPCNQEKDSMLALKRILKAEVRSSLRQ